MSNQENSLQPQVERVISAWMPGQNRVNFTSNATTYGELKEELIANGFDLEDVRVTEGNTQIDLVSDNAQLPTNILRRGSYTNDLIIIMTPQTKIKSGSIGADFDVDRRIIVDLEDYKEMKAFIGTLYNHEDEDIKNKARAYFGNYTQLSKVKMRELLISLDFSDYITQEECDEEVIKEVSNEDSTKEYELNRLKGLLQYSLVECQKHFNEINRIISKILKEEDNTPDMEELEEMLNKINE